MDDTILASFPGPLNIAIIGSSGAIGSAMVSLIGKELAGANLHLFARSCAATPDDLPALASIRCHSIDLTDPDSIERAAETIEQPLDMVLLLTGLLHQDDLQPEKSLKDIDAVAMQKVFAINTIGPALVAQAFLPKLAKNKKTIFAALSARVGSISDNRLGGWHSYRASKAALNMLIKNFSIEVARKNKQAIIVGLHPGTVDSRLSKPFQKNVKPEQLFSADYSAKKLLQVIGQLTVKDSGGCFAWDGKKIPE